MERKGLKPKRPEGPELPRGFSHVWNTFVRLHAARTGSGFGANPITYVEIDAYCRLSRLPLDPWEIEVIRALDDAYLAEAKD